MKITLGQVFNRDDVPPLVWDPDSKNSTNPHILITGSSGSGKSTLIRYLISKQAQGDPENNQLGKHIYVFDLKGDMIIKNDKGEPIGNYIQLTSWGSAYGINPFEFDTGLPKNIIQDIIDDKHQVTADELKILKNSGTKIQVERLIEIIKKNFLPNMSTQQNDVLKKLFDDTYIMKGIIYNDYKTWLNDLPSFKDTFELIERIRSFQSNQESAYFDDETISFIKDIHKNVYLVQDIMKEVDEADNIKIKEEKLTSIKQKLNATLSSYFDNCVSSYKQQESTINSEWFASHNIDINEYIDKDVFKTLVKLSSYIKGFNKMSVFHAKPLPVKAGLNIIEISGLEVSTQRFIVDILLGKIFTACKIRGEYVKRKNKVRGEKCDTFVVIDESKLVAGSASQKKDPYSFLNRIASESRGYGLGLLVASQSAAHFPEEFTKNFDSQILLKTNIADLDVAKRSFGVPTELLVFTQKRYGNALVKLNSAFIKTKLVDLSDTVK